MTTEKKMKTPVNKKTVFLFFYIVFMVLFVAWLCLSNRIVLHLFAPTPNVVGLQQLPPDAVEPWYAYIDIDEPLGNLTQDHTFVGYAFVESDDAELYTNSVDVLLISPEASYSMSTTLRVRGTLIEYYKDNPRIHRPEMSGFLCNFSALGIRDGRYELGFNVHQTNGDEWLVRSGWFYQKDGTGLYYIT